jgi:hypothetical protein
MDITIPRGDIIGVNAPRGGFLSRLFAPAFPRFSVSCRADGVETHFSFSVDPGSGLLAALVKSAKAQEAGGVPG